MNEALQEELEVLESIYGENILHWSSESCNTVAYTNEDLIVTFKIASGYPDVCPTIEMKLLRKGILPITKETIIAETYEYLTANSGQVVIYQTIEFVRDRLEQEYLLDSKLDGPTESSVADIYVQCATDDIDCSPDWNSKELTQYGSVSNISYVRECDPKELCPPIIHGEVTVERKSSFQTHLCRVQSMDEVLLFRSTIVADKRFARATHNIFAYRFTNTVTGVLHHDYDDDGETAAGGRVAEMMRLMGVNDVAVIVSRWFGGTLLGPDRFKFICNSARRALEDNGFGLITSGNQKKKVSGHSGSGSGSGHSGSSGESDTVKMKGKSER